MKIISFFRKKRSLNRPVCITGAAMSAILLTFLLCMVEISSAEMPTLAEKKSVVLDKNHAEVEHIFAVTCAKCHPAPNPIKPISGKPACWRGLSEGDHTQVQRYVADVVNGKRHYESRCGRCHELIPPSSHQSEYWSKNVCTSEECFIKNLNIEEEQQVLLYLRSQAKKD